MEPAGNGPQQVASQEAAGAGEAGSGDAGRAPEGQPSASATAPAAAPPDEQGGAGQPAPLLPATQQTGSGGSAAIADGDGVQRQQQDHQQQQQQQSQEPDPSQQGRSQQRWQGTAGASSGGSPLAEVGSPDSRHSEEVLRAAVPPIKDRVRWTPELHALFVAAVDSLGGPVKAKPKEIMAAMKVPNLSLNHIKSHLQKYRTTEAAASRRKSWEAAQQQLGPLAALLPGFEDCAQGAYSGSGQYDEAWQQYKRPRPDSPRAAPYVLGPQQPAYSAPSGVQARGVYGSSQGPSSSWDSMGARMGQLQPGGYGAPLWSAGRLHQQPPPQQPAAAAAALLGSGVPAEVVQTALQLLQYLQQQQQAPDKFGRGGGTQQGPWAGGGWAQLAGSQPPAVAAALNQLALAGQATGWAAPPQQQHQQPQYGQPPQQQAAAGAGAPGDRDVLVALSQLLASLQQQAPEQGEQQQQQQSQQPLQPQPLQPGVSSRQLGSSGQDTTEAVQLGGLLPLAASGAARGPEATGPRLASHRRRREEEAESLLSSGERPSDRHAQPWALGSRGGSTGRGTQRGLAGGEEEKQPADQLRALLEAAALASGARQDRGEAPEPPPAPPPLLKVEPLHAGDQDEREAGGSCAAAASLLQRAQELQNAARLVEQLLQRDASMAGDMRNAAEGRTRQFAQMERQLQASTNALLGMARALQPQAQPGPATGSDAAAAAAATAARGPGQQPRSEGVGQQHDLQEALHTLLRSLAAAGSAGPQDPDETR